MTERVLGERGSKRRKRFLLLPVLATTVLALFWVAGAQAVHDVGVFQLDKNASTAVQSTPPAAEDWDLICKANPSRCTFAAGYSVPSGTTKADPNEFVTDPSESQQDDILKGGTKDDNEISSWKWASAKPSPPKNDITHAFAAEYTCKGSETNSIPGCTGNTGDKLLYFGGDRFSNSGSANLAFWFFQNKVQQLTQTGQPVGPGNLVCTLGAGCPFSGTHKAGEVPHDPTNTGDLLIISAFGPKAQIQVYEWVGVGNAPSPCFTNACSLVPLIPATAGQACEDVTLDNACATVNELAGTPSPWTLSQKNAPADQFDATNFFEGGINLTNLGLANACFSSFLLNTRASAAGNAELHDKVIGEFGRCGASLKTQRSATTVPIGGSLTDDAIVTISGSTNPPTGIVSFFACGPGVTSCAVTGTPFDTKDLSGAVQSGNDFTVTSAAFTPNAAGTWCFAASWPGDSNYQQTGGFRDDGTNECFTVTPAQPAISTQATGAGGLPLGSSLDDTATLSGTVNDPDGSVADGTITFTAYGPHANTTTCATVAYTSVVNVSGNGPYTASSGTGGTFTPTQPGTYNWIAVYSGDPPNNLGVSGACGDANEGSVIISLQPSITTTQTFTVKDSATITVASGGGNLTGSVRFRLFETLDCTGSTLVDQSFTISGPSPQTKETTPVSITTSKPTLSWLVEYANTNPAHKGVQSVCHNENSSVAIDNGSPSSVPFP